MDRRQFLLTSVPASVAAIFAMQQKAHAGSTQSVDTPLPDITAAVDVILPADPDIPGDFKASDYGADQAVAKKLGPLGQLVVVLLLNCYALRVARRPFASCSQDERLEALQAWISEKDRHPSLVRDVLSGLLSMTSIGVFENKPLEERLYLYESMGWYDPANPGGTYRIPCDGYTMD